MIELKPCPRCGNTPNLSHIRQDRLFLNCNDINCTFHLQIFMDCPGYPDYSCHPPTDFKELKDLLCKWWDELPRKKEDPIVSELKKMRRRIESIIHIHMDYSAYSEVWREVVNTIDKLYRGTDNGSYLELLYLQIIRLISLVQGGMEEEECYDALRCSIEIIQQIEATLEND